jgi:anti-sigma regulatory factor (Ser/Thr protein kinase)
MASVPAVIVVPDERFAAELAFSELIANAVRHAPGPVVALCRVAPGGTVTIELDDAGTGFVPPGRGLALIRRLTEEVQVSSVAGGRASVRVRLNGEPAQEPAGSLAPLIVTSA